MISIPLWYDYKPLCVQIIAVLLLFQFLYGTIISILFRGFHDHPKLFQFLYGTIISFTPNSIVTGSNFISIPLWYDYKWIDIQEQYGDISFQFLYGTIISGFADNIDTTALISIPLWYDYKFTPWCNRGGSYLISIPLWYDYKL